MNLYNITFSHHAPKDSEYGIKVLLLAETDEEVYEWIASEPEISENNKLYNAWKDKENGNYEDEDDDVEYGEYDNENWKDYMIRIKGEINDEYADFSDAYYGITLLGWELLKENVTTDYTELIELGIMFKAKS